MIIFCKQTIEVNRSINALFEEHFESAVKKAHDLDIFLASMNSEEYEDYVSSKHLLGIPLSVKDVFEMKDSDCTNGILYLCNKPAKQNGMILNVLCEIGGVIPFCKTSCPQLLLSPENWNHIIGHTLNPHNLSRTPGGSSGGEAALIAANGSVLGLGSDIGGSLRIPANFCGIIAFKPSSQRNIAMGKLICHTSTVEDGWEAEHDIMFGVGRYTGKYTIKASLGPMCKNVDDCVAFLKCVWNQKVFDMQPYCAPLPFNDAKYGYSVNISFNNVHFTHDL